MDFKCLSQLLKKLSQNYYTETCGCCSYWNVIDNAMGCNLFVPVLGRAYNEKALAFISFKCVMVTSSWIEWLSTNAFPNSLTKQGAVDTFMFIYVLSQIKDFDWFGQLVNVRSAWWLVSLVFLARRQLLQLNGLWKLMKVRCWCLYSVVPIWSSWRNK